MAFIYWLPDEQGQKQEYGTNSNSVIIIGANGSGKSKLGAWIEQQNFENVHRIGAQRNLNFNENIALKSYSQAEDFVFGVLIILVEEMAKVIVGNGETSTRQN